MIFEIENGNKRSIGSDKLSSNNKKGYFVLRKEEAGKIRNARTVFVFMAVLDLFTHRYDRTGCIRVTFISGNLLNENVNKCYLILLKNISWHSILKDARAARLLLPVASLFFKD